MLKLCKDVAPTGWNWPSCGGAGAPGPLQGGGKDAAGKPYCCGGHMALLKGPKEVADAAGMGVAPREDVIEIQS